MKDEGNDKISLGEQAKKRRKLITSIAAVSGATAASEWRKPIVGSVVLPAHAQSTAIAIGNFSGVGSITTP